MTDVSDLSLSSVTFTAYRRPVIRPVFELDTRDVSEEKEERGFRNDIVRVREVALVIMPCGSGSRLERAERR